MKESTNIILIVLCAFLCACNLGNNSTNRVVTPTTNLEKASNLWLDLASYSKCYIKKDSRGYAELSNLRLFQYLGGDSILISNTEKYFENQKDYEFITLKLTLAEGAFVTTEDTIFAFITKTKTYERSNSNRSISYNSELIAESTDNGVNWKFANLDSMEYAGLENFFSEKVCELIRDHLERGKNGVALTTREVTNYITFGINFRFKTR